jgi:hypothetical protein
VFEGEGRSSTNSSARTRHKVGGPKKINYNRCYTPLHALLIDIKIEYFACLWSWSYGIRMILLSKYYSGELILSGSDHNEAAAHCSTVLLSKTPARWSMREPQRL